MAFCIHTANRQDFCFWMAFILLKLSVGFMWHVLLCYTPYSVSSVVCIGLWGKTLTIKHKLVAGKQYVKATILPMQDGSCPVHKPVVSQYKYLGPCKRNPREHVKWQIVPLGTFSPTAHSWLTFRFDESVTTAQNPFSEVWNPWIVVNKF